VVRRAKQFSRRAFTIIELIFAIVIISISVVSLPMMIQVNNQSMEDSMVQEAIFAASVELMNASAGYWDASSMADNAVNHLSRVIDIGGTCEGDPLNSRYRLRTGHIAQPFHRRCVENATVGPLNAFNVAFPNLDNARDVGSKEMFTENVTEEAGYKKIYNSLVSVEQDGNVKRIDIDVTDEDGETVTILRMQSANIGEIDYYKRTL